MREPGEIRRRDDGTFEYLRSVSVSLRHGAVEEWESVVVHAAKHMRLPDKFYENLVKHGYRGGGHLYDLMIAEGWRAPERGYVEIERAADSRKLAEEQSGEYIRQTLHEPTDSPFRQPATEDQG